MGWSEALERHYPGRWAKEQITRVQEPVYAAKRLKLARKKRRAKYDGVVEYRGPRRLLRQDGRIAAAIIRMEAY